MNTESKGLQINIMGREFRVACQESEQKGLLEAVEFLNRKMLEIRDNGKVIGIERIAIMAALNIAHEFLATKVGGGFDIAEIKRRIAGMETALDQAISDQSELF
jgi:cell division protein ZapA